MRQTKKEVNKEFNQHRMHSHARLTALFATMLAVSACNQSDPLMQPDNSSTATAINFSGGKASMVDVSSKNPNADPRIEQALQKLRAKRGGSLKLRRPEAWSKPPVYVVAPSLPEGVIYKVVRNASSATPRVIVFSEATMTDDQLYRSVGRLALDEMRTPMPTGERTITMYADNHYVVESNGRAERAVVHNGMTNETAPIQAQGPESRMVLREAARSEIVSIAPGVRGRAFRPGAQ